MSAKLSVQIDPVITKLGAAIQQRRWQMKLSQEELAKRSGLHRTYVSDVERGSRSMSVLTLCRLAAALEVPPSELVALVDDMMAPHKNADDCPHPKSLADDCNSRTPVLDRVSSRTTVI